MTPYCKHCVYHLKFVDKLKRDGQGDSDVCGKSLETVTDSVGNVRLKMHGDKEICEECGQVTKDNRLIIYEKCERKNKDFKCKDFKAKLHLRLPFLFRRSNVPN